MDDAYLSTNTRLHSDVSDRFGLLIRVKPDLAVGLLMGRIDFRQGDVTMEPGVPLEIYAASRGVLYNLNQRGSTSAAFHRQSAEPESGLNCQQSRPARGFPTSSARSRASNAPRGKLKNRRSLGCTTHSMSLSSSRSAPSKPTR